MEQTHKYGLKKPDENDYCDVAVLNENMDAIETALDGLEQGKAALDASGKIPAEQLPPMNYDPAGSAAAVQTGLNSHTGNKNNPHGVTAAQVGAAASNHSHTAAQVGAAGKSIKTSKTITTSWAGSNAPYTQSISVEGVTATSIVELTLPTTITAAQVAAFQALNVQDGGQSAGIITLRAFGTKNTTAIPITIIVRGDM